MSLVAAAVCPTPPLLVGALAGAAAPELDRLRAACRTAVDRLIGADVDVVAVVGAAGPAATGLDRFGLAYRLAPVPLPLALALGYWLLDGAGCPGRREPVSVPGDAPTADCLALGQRLAAGPGRLGLLVMGDGSARRGVAAPGYLDPRAAGFDAAAADALGRGDAGALGAVDPALAAELMVAGRAAWQVLAGAAAAADPGAGVSAELLYAAAPYGVGYLVAAWSLGGRPVAPP